VSINLHNNLIISAYKLGKGKDKCTYMEFFVDYKSVHHRIQFHTGKYWLFTSLEVFDAAWIARPKRTDVKILRQDTRALRILLDKQMHSAFQYQNHKPYETQKDAANSNHKKRKIQWNCKNNTTLLNFALFWSQAHLKERAKIWLTK